MKWLVLVVLLIVVAVGCGKSTLHYGKYSIGRDPNWFPLEADEDGARLNGFTDALTLEIAKAEGVPLQIINIDWAQLFDGLENGEFGGIFTSLSPSIITQEKYTFSDPLLLLGPVLVVPANSSITSLADLNGKIIGVYQYDESVLIAQRNPSLIIQLYQNKPNALEALASSQYDALLIPVLDAQRLIPSVFASQLKIVTEPLNNKAIRLITLKDANKALIRHFDRGLATIFSSGKYDALLRTFKVD